MRATERLVAASQLLVICPAVLFMGSLAVRNLSPLQNEPAHTAQQIVMWYAGRMWTLWALLIALPLGVLVMGCIMFASSWSKDVRLPKAEQQMLAAIHANHTMLIVAVMTLTAGAVLTIVVLHMLAN
jgi:hypothetical protein